MRAATANPRCWARYRARRKTSVLLRRIYECVKTMKAKIHKLSKNSQSVQNSFESFPADDYFRNYIQTFGDKFGSYLVICVDLRDLPPVA